jgi:hypothetical protein
MTTLIERLQAERGLRWQDVEDAAAELERQAKEIEALEETVASPSKPWFGLTDDEIKGIIGSWGDTPIKGYTRKLFDQIEEKLKEKNT